MSRAEKVAHQCSILLRIISFFKKKNMKNGQRNTKYSILGPVTPLQILLKMESDDLYTIQNPNPKLQPNRPAQFLQQALPSLPYLDFQVGQAGQSLLEKLSWPIWLQTLNC